MEQTMDDDQLTTEDFMFLQLASEPGIYSGRMITTRLRRPKPPQQAYPAAQHDALQQQNSWPVSLTDWD